MIIAANPTLRDCDNESGDTRYLCTKRYDVGSVFAHELGHALGLHHPQSVDDYVANGSDGDVAAGLAQCGTNAEAIMCNLIRQGRTGQRSLASWDEESVCTTRTLTAVSRRN